MWCESTPRAASWKPTRDRLVGHREVVPALRPPGADLGQRLLEVVQPDERRVGLVVGPRALALDGVRPLRDLPLELHLGHEAGLRQRHLDALARGLQVADVDEAGLRRDPLAGERAAAGVAGRRTCRCACRSMRGEATHEYLSAKSRSCGLGSVTLFHGWRLSTGLPSGSLVTNVSSLVPVVEVRRAEQDPDRQVDLDEVGRDQLAVEHEAGRDVPVPAPLGHGRVVVVDVVRVVEAAPADEVRVAVADLLVARQRLVEEVVEVVVHRHGALAVVHVAHQAHVVLRARLLGDVRAAAARHDRRRVRVAAAEQAVHLARVARHLQGLQVELAGERVERAHDVGDRLVAVDVGVRRRRLLRLREDRGVGLLDHLLAVVHVRHAVVEDRVVEHEVGGLGEVERVVAELRRLDPVGHVLVQARAGAVVVTADAADAAGDEVRVARVDPLHEDVEAAEDHRRRVALEDLLVGEVDLRVDPERPDDAGDRIPRHLLDDDLLLRWGSLRSPWSASYQRFW